MNLRSGEGCAACCCCRASMAVESPPVPPWQPKGSTMATKGRVEGKVVLITGAAHGLGKADAEALAREGARVIVADVDEEEAQRVADMLPAAMALRLDVTCEAQWQAALTKIMHAYGRLDALVNNAGIAAFETVEQSSLEAFRRVMAVSAEGTFLGCETCLPALAASGAGSRSEEHTSELQSLMRISYAVFCLKKKIQKHIRTNQ